MQDYLYWILKFPELFIPYILELVIFIWLSLCLYIIAEKMGAINPWLSWIPFANFYLMCKMVEKPTWWLAVFCIAALLSIPTALMPAMTLYGIGEQGLKFLWYPGVLLALPMIFLPTLFIQINVAWFSILVATLATGIFFWVLFVKVWMGISKARGKPSWLGTLTVVPIANLIVPGILAFSDKQATEK